MKSATKKQPRHTIRLPEYDYTQARAYFITIVTHNRACMFGEIANGKMRLNRAGRIAHQEWQRVSQRFSNVQPDVFVVMPNHIHAILIIEPEAAAGATQTGPAAPDSGIDPLTDQASTDTDTPPQPSESPKPHGPGHASLGAIIGQSKSVLTRHLWTLPELSKTPIWQRNYYQHIIRSDYDHNCIAIYIKGNPASWSNDEENPDKPE